MAKIPIDENIDVAAVLGRMIIAARKINIDLKNYTQLALEMGISPQAIGNTVSRKSMSLSFLIKASIKFGVGLDYLVYGIGSGDPVIRDEKIFERHTADENYLEIVKIGGGTIFFLAELLHHGIDPSKLRADIQDGKMHIINTGDLAVKTGIYAFGDINRPAFRQCDLLIDGSVVVKDEERASSAEELNRYGIIGKVIWIGAAP